MSLAIDDFKAKLTGGGVRGNLYSCIINSPSVASIPSELTTFMCKAASLPSSVIGQIDVPFRGRQLRVAGDRTFENWTATLYNDQEFQIRNGFETWLNAINAHASGLQSDLSPTAYQAQIIVNQLDRTNAIIKTYTIEGAFPINISGVDVAYDNNDTIEEFTVEFAYQYWTSDTTS